jgi:chemotaxis signal transduction protein
VAQYKGTILSVLDGAKFLQFDEIPYGFQQCLVILSVADSKDRNGDREPEENGEWMFGMKVHSLEDLIRVPAEALRETEREPGGGGRPFVSATVHHNGLTLSVVDLEKVVQSGSLLV